MHRDGEEGQGVSDALLFPNVGDDAGAEISVAEAAALFAHPAEKIALYAERGRIKSRRTSDGTVLVSRCDVERFLDHVRQDVQYYHRDGLSEELGFYDVPEWERTKHVHRLHPYLGKFIPQLVEHFLRRYFKPGDTVLDPFMGSGTTLVEANVLGIHSIGVDISAFNCRIAEVKTRTYDIDAVEREARDLLARVTAFSRAHFDGGASLPFAADWRLSTDSDYLRTWFADRTLQEILFYREHIPEYEHGDLLRIILSRAARSARLIPHYDLATPDEPVREPYYCHKHKKTCEPIGECLKFIHRYTFDTVRRLREFAAIRTKSRIEVVHGDSRTVHLDAPLDGIFTSPPYVGQIDYHEQHRYAYELFGIPRADEQEIGPKRAGKSASARKRYCADIAAVLRNFRPNLRPGAQVFIVANDRLGLYGDIARQAGFEIVETVQRAVSKRTERDRKPYTESIFILRKKEEGR